jgi:hypothetical protein
MNIEGFSTTVAEGNGANHPGRQASEHVRLRNQAIADAIRAGGRSHRQIAEQFGCSVWIVSDVSRYDMRGRPKPTKKSRRQHATVGVISPATASIATAETQLKRAQADVLVAEAILLEARGQLCRERAASLRRAA